MLLVDTAAEQEIPVLLLVDTTSETAVDTAIETAESDTDTVAGLGSRCRYTTLDLDILDSDVVDVLLVLDVGTLPADVDTLLSAVDSLPWISMPWIPIPMPWIPIPMPWIPMTLHCRSWIRDSDAENLRC